MNDLKQMIIGVGACCFLLFLMGCGGMRKPAKQSQALPSIFPDYTDVTIPSNIAPLNFMIEGAEHIQARFLVAEKELLAVYGDEVIDIPEDDWKHLLQQTVGKKCR